jgi:hypothetical protein
VIGGALAATLFLFVATTWALAKGNEPAVALMQAREFLIFVGVLAAGLYLYRGVPDGFGRVARALLLGGAAYSLAKLVALGLFLSGMLDLGDLTDVAEAVFGQRVARLEVEGSLPRIHMGQDLALPFVLYFALASFKSSRVSRLDAILVGLVGFGVVISLSRYLWFTLALVLLLAWWRALLRHPRAAVAAMLVGGAFATWIVLGTEMGRSTIEVRVFSAASTIGDEIRDEQRDMLAEEFRRHPILGKGMGGYSGRLIRSEEAPYSYENQWSALRMQFGIVGLGILIVAPLLWLARLLRAGPGLRGWSAAAVYVAFLGQGFFNPTLTSSTSAAVFLAFALLADGNRPAEA